MKFIETFWNIIKKSCDKTNEFSSTRLTSFIFSAFIALFVLYFLGIGIYIVIIGSGSIPTEMIVVFGALLAHQLTLLGINKHHETKQQNEKSNEKSNEKIE